MQVHGFTEVIVSVEDIDRLGQTLSRVAGWTIEDLPDAPPEQFGAWKVPSSCTRIEQKLLTAENDSNGHLRLVKFHGCEAQSKFMRSSQRCWDTGGIFNIDVYVKDVDSLYRELQREGWTAFGDPVDYEWGGFEVRENVAISPDGITIGMLQAYGIILIDLPEFAHMSRAFNSAQIVRDFEASMAFFTDKLGWKTLVNSSVKDAIEPGQELFGIPSPIAYSVERKVSILHPQGTNNGGVELIEMAELTGRDFSQDCIAPNLGYLALRFPVEGLGAYAEEIMGRGVELYSGLSEVEIVPYGKCRSFSLKTPDGAILEFYEAL